MTAGSSMRVEEGDRQFRALDVGVVTQARERDRGIGKSRLVASACAQARREGAVTAVDGCVRLGEGSVAFAPFIELVRQLHDELGAERFAELAGPGLDAGMIVPGRASPPDPSSVFDRVMGLLIRLSESRPALVVLEDLHWADASTRDLVAFLARMLRTARVTLVLTYRGDELHRRHPLRPLLEELERNPRLERIRLTGLSRPELAELVDAIRPGPALPPERIDRLLARTQGNPFYAEELVAAGASGGRPGSLSDVQPGREQYPRASRDVRPGWPLPQPNTGAPGTATTPASGRPSPSPGPASASQRRPPPRSAGR